MTASATRRTKREPEPVKDPVLQAAEAAGVFAQTRPDEVTLSNGVVFGLKPVSPFTIRALSAKEPPPEVPIVWIEDKEREEPNPNDEDYIKAVVAYNNRMSDALLSLLIMQGTWVKSVPEGMSGPGDDAWVQSLRAAGIEPRLQNEFTRYHDWVTMIALTEYKDISLLTYSCFRVSGTAEAEVQRVLASFRGVS